jgi:hypothetical protein
VQVLAFVLFAAPPPWLRCISDLDLFDLLLLRLALHSMLIVRLSAERGTSQSCSTQQSPYGRFPIRCITTPHDTNAAARTVTPSTSLPHPHTPHTPHTPPPSFP